MYGATIGIHNTWSFETKGYLKGHTGKIRSLCWSTDDTKLVTCGIDGNIFTWNVRTMSREGEITCQGTLFSSVCYDIESKYAYAVGSDGAIKVCASFYPFYPPVLPKKRG